MISVLSLQQEDDDETLEGIVNCSLNFLCNIEKKTWLGIV